MARWQNIWILFLGLNFLIVLDNLNDQKTDVSYFSTFSLIDTLPMISACVPLKENFVDCKEDSDPYSKLLCFVSRMSKKGVIPSEVIKYAVSLDIHRMFNVNAINYDLKRSSIYINNFHICMAYDILKKPNLNSTNEEKKQTLFKYDQQIYKIDQRKKDFLLSESKSEYIKMIITVENVYKVSVKLFVLANKEVGYSFSLYKFYQHCSRKANIQPQCNAGQIEVSNTIYQRKKAPYKTDCKEYLGEKFKFNKSKIFNRVSCLSECRKSIFTDKLFLH